MTKGTLATIFAIILFLYCNLFGSELTSSALYKEADALYQAGEFVAAGDLFTQAANKLKKGDKQKALFLAGKAYYRGEHYDNARYFFQSLLEKQLPYSLAATSKYYLANIDYLQGFKKNAAYKYIEAYQIDRSDIRKETYLESLKPLIIKKLSLLEVENLLQAVNDSDLESNLFCFLAERYFAEQKFQELSDKIENQLIINENSPCLNDLQLLQRECKYRLSNKPRIAVIAPQTGIFAPYGQDIFDAVTLAFENYNNNSSEQIEIIKYDSKGTAVGAAIACGKINEPISAIIGPLTSPAAASVISANIDKEIAVISPTASESGLTDISNNFFQITPSPGTMAAGIAQFAVEELSLDSVAIIYPNDAAGREAMEAFTYSARELGIEVFYSASFIPQVADFRKILLDLKEEILPDTFDTTIFINVEGDTLETEEVPLLIQAIYIPASEFQLELLIPQINFYKIEAVYLGDANWSTARVSQLKELDNKEIYFSADYLNLPDDLEFNYFYNTFQQQFGRPPDLVAAKAYDAALMISLAISESNSSAKNILKYLRELRSTNNGVTGTIRLNAKLENEATGIYQLDSGKITRLK